ncbi:unnamed protein product [Agarophyton chilense]
MGAVLGRIGVETPAHVVVRRAEGYEVWRYPSSVVAVVRAHSLDPANPPTGDAFSNQAFRALARYIGVFGTPQNTPTSAVEHQNTESDPQSQSQSQSQPEAEPQSLSMTAPVIVPAPQKLAMTAPVIMPASKPEAAQRGADCMMFVLPSHITRVEDAPRPTNDAVQLQMLPAGRCEAVLSFTGSFDFERNAEKAAQLLAMLQRDKVSVVGDWNAQGYNPPFTLPWLKRNEVHVPVDPQPYEHIDGEAKTSE